MFNTQSDNISESVNEILNLISNLSIDNMTTLSAAKEIAHTLKPFSGKSEHLEFFVNSIDKFYNRYNIATDETLQEFVFATICSKIIDEAGDYLLCHPELTTWPLIKDELRNKFGDKINRHTLSQQLNFLSKYKNESTLDFLDRIKILKNRINVKINSERLVQATKTALIEQNERSAITVLLANISSELRTILMINNPQDLDDTYNLVLNHTIIEQQINNRHQVLRNNIPQTLTNPRQNNRHQHQPNFNNSYSHINTNSYQNPFPNQPINIQPRPVQHRFPTNAEVFGKPQNIFNKNRRVMDAPTPMSGVSIQPRNQQPFQRPQPSQNLQHFQRSQPSQNVQHFQRPQTSQNLQHFQRPQQNLWQRNPHANPLSFTEITHLENDNDTTYPHYEELPIDFQYTLDQWDENSTHSPHDQNPEITNQYYMEDSQPQDNDESDPNFQSSFQKDNPS